VDLWGTYVTTPQINADSAAIAIQTSVKNELNLQRSVKVEQNLYDATGTLIAKTDGNVIVASGDSRQLLQNLVVKKPVLWNIDTPYLYK